MEIKAKMKADSTVRKELRRLRQLIDSPDTDDLTKRVVWQVEQAIRWAREDVKGWPSPTALAVSGANLIREEIKREIRLSPTDEDVEKFLRALPWSEDATEFEKTLVAGNVRGFASHLRARAALAGKQEEG